MIHSSVSIHLGAGVPEATLTRSHVDPDRYLLDVRDGDVLVTAYGTIDDVYGYVRRLAAAVKGWDDLPDTAPVFVPAAGEPEACEGSELPPAEPRP